MTPIERCPEGHEAVVVHFGRDCSWVSCRTDECWDGPSCPTPEEAIEKWNAIMQLVRRAEEVLKKIFPPEGE